MKKISACFSVGFLVLALACSKDNKNVATTTSPPARGNSESEANGKAQDFENSYQGSINNQYQIEMNLKRTSNNLSGSYFYTKHKKDIQISGTLDSQNNLILNEFDSGGNQTGIFKGILSATGIEGTWSKPNGDKAMPFSLTGILNAPQVVTSTPNTSKSDQPLEDIAYRKGKEQFESLHTKCGEYYVVASTLDDRIFVYKTVASHIQKIDLTEADKLNNIEFNGNFVSNAGFVRTCRPTGPQAGCSDWENAKGTLKLAIQKRKSQDLRVQPMEHIARKKISCSQIPGWITQ